MKLWLDDIRPAPPGWEWARSTVRAIALLSTGEVTEVSLDHDLGQGGVSQTAAGILVGGADCAPGCGYDVATWIEERAHAGELAPIRWSVHSANPVGRQRMVAAMESAERAWVAQHGKRGNSYVHPLAVEDFKRRRQLGGTAIRGGAR